MANQRPESEQRLRQNLRLRRILHLLQLLQGRGRWNVPALAGELECSARTVHRYLDVLELAGVPYFYDQEEQCYRVRPDFRFPVLNLTEEEAWGQAVATALTRAPSLNVGPGAKPTTQKLMATSGDAARRILQEAQDLIAVLDLKLTNHSQHAEAIRTVQTALLERRQLVGQYLSPYQAKSVKLRLEPYRLCLVRAAWYVIGKASDRDHPRTYRMARFQTLRLVDAPAVIPADFDLQAYFGHAWGVWRGAPTFDVEIEFTPEAADVVTETVWHFTQKVRRHPDRHVTLTFQVDGLQEIVHWILCWTGKVRVIQPKELRDMVVVKLREALAMNEHAPE